MVDFVRPDLERDSELRGYAWQLCVWGEFDRAGIDRQHVPHTGWEAWQPIASQASLNWPKPNGHVDHDRPGSWVHTLNQIRQAPDGEVRLHFKWWRPSGVAQHWAFECKSGHILRTDSIEWANRMSETLQMPVRFIMPHCRVAWVLDSRDALRLLNDEGLVFCQPYHPEHSRTFWRPLSEVLRYDHGLHPTRHVVQDPRYWWEFARELEYQVPALPYTTVVELTDGDPWSLFSRGFRSESDKKEPESSATEPLPTTLVTTTA